MDPVILNILIAIFMVAIGAVVVVWFLGYKRAASERRMIRMLSRAGVDPYVIQRGDTRAIISDVRRRCRKCQTEALCERWLDGDAEGENSFCPNAQIFSNLKRTTRRAA